jgi:hypothetical protein
MIPIQCVRYINDEDGAPATVVFLQAAKSRTAPWTLSPEAQADLRPATTRSVSTGLSVT